MLIFYAPCATVAGMIRLVLARIRLEEWDYQDFRLIGSSFVDRKLLCRHLFSGSRLWVSGSFLEPVLR